MRMRSGRWAAAAARPASPSSASMTSKSALVSKSRRICRLSSCSSITRMRLLIMAPLPFEPHRQREIEGRSLAERGLHPDAPAVHLDDALGDRQAEAGPALFARDRAVSLLKLLEDFRLISRGDPGPGI